MKQILSVALLFFFQLNPCLSQELCSAEKLNTELEQVLERDQGLRTAQMLAGYDQKFAPSAEHQAAKDKILEDLREADKNNRALVLNIFETCGWPDARQLSYKANSALFLVIQHGYKEDRAKYFPYFEKQYQEKTLHSARYVMMVDRMQFDQGLGQLYGTHYVPDKSGVTAYGEVFEPEKLNDRREQMNMSRILVFDEAYPPPKKQDKSSVKSK